MADKKRPASSKGPRPCSRGAPSSPGNLRSSLAEIGVPAPSSSGGSQPLACSGPWFNDSRLLWAIASSLRTTSFELTFDALLSKIQTFAPIEASELREALNEAYNFSSAEDAASAEDVENDFLKVQELIKSVARQSQDVLHDFRGRVLTQHRSLYEAFSSLTLEDGKVLDEDEFVNGFVGTGCDPEKLRPLFRLLGAGGYSASGARSCALSVHHFVLTLSGLTHGWIESFRHKMLFKYRGVDHAWLHLTDESKGVVNKGGDPNAAQANHSLTGAKKRLKVSLDTFVREFGQLFGSDEEGSRKAIQIFEFCDRNMDGKLEYPEFQLCVASAAPPASLEDLRVRLLLRCGNWSSAFQKLDCDGGAEIEEAELEKLGGEFDLRPENMKEIFNRLDTDGSGTLTMQEFFDSLSLTGDGFTLHELQIRLWLACPEGEKPIDKFQQTGIDAERGFLFEEFAHDVFGLESENQMFAPVKTLKGGRKGNFGGATPSGGSKKAASNLIQCHPKLTLSECKMLFQEMRRRTGRVSLRALTSELVGSCNTSDCLASCRSEYAPGDVALIRYRIPRLLQNALLAAPFIGIVPLEMKFSPGGGGCWFLRGQQITEIHGSTVPLPNKSEGHVQLVIPTMEAAGCDSTERLEFRVFSSPNGQKVGKQVGEGIPFSVTPPRAGKPRLEQLNERSLAVQWTPPMVESASSDTIVDYNLKVIPETRGFEEGTGLNLAMNDLWSPERQEVERLCEYQLTGLQRNTAYRIVVQPVYQGPSGARFMGAESAASDLIVTPPGPPPNPPCAPTLVAALPNSVVELSWPVPWCTTPIITYKLEKEGDADLPGEQRQPLSYYLSCDATIVKCRLDVKDLPLTSAVRVSAVGLGGESEWSEWSAALIDAPENPPAAPLGAPVIKHRLGAEIELEWNVASAADAGAAAAWEVEAMDDAGNWTQVSDVFSRPQMLTAGSSLRTICGLVRGEKVRHALMFRVRALAMRGTPGDWSIPCETVLQGTGTAGAEGDVSLSGSLSDADAAVLMEIIEEAGGVEELIALCRNASRAGLLKKDEKDGNLTANLLAMVGKCPGGVVGFLRMLEGFDVSKLPALIEFARNSGFSKASESWGAVAGMFGSMLIEDMVSALEGLQNLGGPNMVKLSSPPPGHVGLFNTLVADLGEGAEGAQRGEALLGLLHNLGGSKAFLSAVAEIGPNMLQEAIHMARTAKLNTENRVEWHMAVGRVAGLGPKNVTQLLDSAKACGGVEVLTEMVDGINMKSFTTNVDKLRKLGLIHKMPAMSRESQRREESSKVFYSKLEALGGVDGFVTAMGDLDPTLLVHAVRLAVEADLSLDTLDGLLELMKVMKMEAGVARTIGLLQRLAGSIASFLRNTLGCSAHLIDLTLGKLAHLHALQDPLPADPSRDVLLHKREVNLMNLFSFVEGAGGLSKFNDCLGVIDAALLSDAFALVLAAKISAENSANWKVLAQRINNEGTVESTSRLLDIVRGCGGPAILFDALKGFSIPNLPQSLGVLNKMKFATESGQKYEQQCKEWTGLVEQTHQHEGAVIVCKLLTRTVEVGQAQGFLAGVDGIPLPSALKVLAAVKNADLFETKSCPSQPLAQLFALLMKAPDGGVKAFLEATTGLDTHWGHCQELLRGLGNLIATEPHKNTHRGEREKKDDKSKDVLDEILGLVKAWPAWRELLGQIARSDGPQEVLNKLDGIQLDLVLSQMDLMDWAGVLEKREEDRKANKLLCRDLFEKIDLAGGLAMFQWLLRTVDMRRLRQDLHLLEVLRMKLPPGGPGEGKDSDDGKSGKTIKFADSGSPSVGASDRSDDELSSPPWDIPTEDDFAWSVLEDLEPLERLLEKVSASKNISNFLSRVEDLEAMQAQFGEQITDLLEKYGTEGFLGLLDPNDMPNLPTQITFLREQQISSVEDCELCSDLWSLAKFCGISEVIDLLDGLDSATLMGLQNARKLFQGSDSELLPKLLSYVHLMGGISDVLKMLGEDSNEIKMLPKQLELLRQLNLCENSWDLWQWKELVRITKGFGGAQGLLDRIRRLEKATASCRTCREFGFSLARGQAQTYSRVLRGGSVPREGDNKATEKLNDLLDARRSLMNGQKSTNLPALEASEAGKKKSSVRFFNAEPLSQGLQKSFSDPKFGGTWSGPFRPAVDRGQAALPQIQ